MNQLAGIICCDMQQIMALLCDLRRISAQDISAKNRLIQQPDGHEAAEPGGCFRGA